MVYYDTTLLTPDEAKKKTEEVLGEYSNIGCDVLAALEALEEHYAPDEGPVTGERYYIIDGETYDAMVEDMTRIANLKGDA